MSRRDLSLLRCARCRMAEGLCLCARLPRLHTRTRLVVLIHRFEDHKPSNTGRLAAACLVNSEVVVGSEVVQPPPALAIPAGTRPLRLFPADDAMPLDQLPPSAQPVTLLVPDGNWRQAARLRPRVPGLREVPCVTLPPGPPSRYRLRAEPRPGGLATMEAIARALGILEGPAVQAALERVFDVMVDRELWTRGQLDAAAVTGGLPDGVVRAPRRRGSR